MALDGSSAGAAALEILLEQLDARAAGGDSLCAEAVAALRRQGPAAPFAPDALAAAVDRLVRLVREQEAQIRALREMVEAHL